jgi:type IV secretory pathway VirB3-like protein
MKLDYVTVPENLSGFGYYFTQFLVYGFNTSLIISNNYSILFICFVLYICTYFNIYIDKITLFLIIFMARLITYENHHYYNKNPNKEEDENNTKN